MHTALSDLLANASSVVLLAGSALVFGTAAFVGIGLVGRLGGAGWIMYIVVLGTFALVFGPVIASAVALRQKGSARHRAELERRREQQRRKFGLHHRASEAAKAAETADPDAGRADGTATGD
jgi:hypothetical protein